MKDTIRCNVCEEPVENTSEAKTAHILRFHPDAPLRRVVALFNPSLFEFLGYRLGELLKGKV